MSELKSFIVLYDGKFIRAYNESEADKVMNIHRICDTCMMPIEVKNPWNNKAKISL